MPHILYIEDDPIAAEVVSDILASAGHRCDVIERGELAMPAIFDGRPEMVITDMNLPGISGCDVVRLIRKWPGLHWLPVMVLTAYDDQRIQEAAMGAGANAVLTKSARDRDFVDAVNATYAANSLRRRRRRSAT